MHVVLCPGNRNAPLILSFVRFGKFKCYSLIDERSAAFTALGIASFIGLPVAIVCTSGTAVLNFYPAIAEAYYSQIPLIVITADRPPNLIDQWEGQCIRQNAIFEKHIIASYTFDVERPENFDYLKNLKSCIEPTKGPIHINIPLKEPLFGIDNKFYYPEIKKLPLGENIFQNYFPEAKLPTKIVLFAGADAYGARLQKLVKNISIKRNIVIFADILSGLHNVQNIDNWDVICTLAHKKELEKLKPELLITIGKITVSKALKQFIKDNKPLAHWHITPNGTIADPFETNPIETKCNEEDFLKFILKKTENTEKDYVREWMKVSEYYKITFNNLFLKPTYNEFSVCRYILENIGKKCTIYLANGMPVRYMSYLAGNCKNYNIYGNRGTSGIDGTTSAAAGLSMLNKNKTVLITGDTSFFYDVNGLWNKYIKNNFKIIVLNNNGGGIFRLIEGPNKVEERENYLSVSNTRNCRATAESFGLGYFKAENFNDLYKNFDEFINYKKSSAIFEIKFTKDNMIKFYQNFKNLKYKRQ